MPAMCRSLSAVACGLAEVGKDVVQSEVKGSFDANECL